VFLSLARGGDGVLQRRTVDRYRFFKNSTITISLLIAIGVFFV